jgi:hypothetical protein
MLHEHVFGAVWSTPTLQASWALAIDRVGKKFSSKSFLGHTDGEGGSVAAEMRLSCDNMTRAGRHETFHVSTVLVTPPSAKVIVYRPGHSMARPVRNTSEFSNQGRTRDYPLGMDFRPLLRCWKLFERACDRINFGTSIIRINGAGRLCERRGDGALLRLAGFKSRRRHVATR